jgi:hypothetical protein
MLLVYLSKTAELKAQRERAGASGPYIGLLRQKVHPKNTFGRHGDRYGAGCSWGGSQAIMVDPATGTLTGAFESPQRRIGSRLLSISDVVQLRTDQFERSLVTPSIKACMYPRAKMRDRYPPRFPGKFESLLRVGQWSSIKTPR